MTKCLAMHMMTCPVLVFKTPGVLHLKGKAKRDEDADKGTSNRPNKKKFEYFTPNDVLGRILTFDMQREEANERKRLGGLQAKLDGIKIKDVALKANKSSKQGSTSKSKVNKQAQSKQVQEQVETTSSSSESENNDG